MKAISQRSLRTAGVFLALIALPVIVPTSRSQSKTSNDLASIEGTVCDSKNKQIGDAVISLESNGQARKFVAHSDVKGRYRFEAVPPGS